jgi:hypothetical protein
MSVKEFPQIYKGLSTNPANNTDYFEVAQNLVYSRDKRLRTRNGYVGYGQPVPDAAVTLDLCDATTGWGVSEDANTLATGTALRGTNSVSFAITPSAGAASLTKSTLSANLSTAKGYVGFFLFVPTGFKTNLTDVKFRIGSDSSNYYEWTVTIGTENQGVYYALPFSSATTTGTPVDTTIAYARLRATFTGSYAAQAGIRFDDLRAYSATYNSPVTSLFCHLRDDTQKNYILAASGTSLWSMEDNLYWTQIVSGLTEYETTAGWTDCRTRWSFAVYKNVVYMCNGVDAYRAWNGIAQTVYAAQPKVRFLRYMADRVFGAGEDANPTTLYYTATLPADASAINANSGVIGGDEEGRIQGLKDLGSSLLAAKDRKIYNVGLSGSFTATGLDPRNGVLSHRSIEGSGNALLYFNDSGIDQLANRTSTTGAAGLGEVSIGDEVATLLNVPGRFTDRQAVKGFYSTELKNYYLFFPTSGNVPDSCLVYSVLGGWTQYILPAVYDASLLKRTDGTKKILLAQGTSGQLLSLEEGFDDNDDPMVARLLSKKRDFGTSGIFKFIEWVDVIGYKSPGDPLDVNIYLDGTVISSGRVTDSMLDYTSGAFSIGSNPLGDVALGGGKTSSNLEMYPFVLRLPVYADGNAFQYELSSESSSLAWGLQKVRVSVESEQLDFIASSSLA